jgi:NTE family protein
MIRVGLVLGAGGTVGQAYHAGVLAAIERDLGWDPRTADLVVGTSAGSITGTLLRLGVKAEDLAAYAVEAPFSQEGHQLSQWLHRQRQNDVTPPPFDMSDLLRLWRLPSPALLARIIRRPWAFRPSIAAMTMLPAGRVELVEHTSVLDEVLPDHWLEDLWICASRRSDGGRVVFGRKRAPEASISDAVAASCAIPGYFAPVTIDGVEYFDGGVHSPTNADVLRREDLDLVVVLSPMSTAGSILSSTDGPMRYSAHRRLIREVNRLKNAGAEVVWFEPGPDTLPVMGVNMMADDRSSRVVQASFLEAGEFMRDPKVLGKLAPINARPSPGPLAA